MQKLYITHEEKIDIQPPMQWRSVIKKKEKDTILENIYGVVKYVSLGYMQKVKDTKNT